MYPDKSLFYIKMVGVRELLQEREFLLLLNKGRIELCYQIGLNRPEGDQDRSGELRGYGN